MSVTIVSRAAAGLAPPKAPAARLNATWGTTGHHNGPPLWRGRPVADWDHNSCPTKVRGTQAFHMGARNWNDVAYNFLLCPHGVTFEGRGVGRRSAANGTTDGNAVSYAVMFLIGEGEPVTDAMADEFAELVDYLRAEGGAGPGVGPHKRWKSTECPGSAGEALVARVAGGWRPQDRQPVVEWAPSHVPWRVMAPHPGGGYWLTNEVGWVFSFDAPFYGSLGGLQLNAPVVGMAARPQGDGYWLVAADGGVFAFGAAPFAGNVVGQPLAGSVEGIVSSPSGEGYWLLGSDGGVFALGDAPFHGSVHTVV